MRIMGKFTDYLLSVGVYIRDAVSDEIDQHYDQIINEEVEEAVVSARHRYISSATRAFIELKVPDVEVYRLLDEYFNVKRTADAAEYLSDAKAQMQRKKFRQYMIDQGMSSQEFREYARDHELDIRLREDAKLLDMTPEKLKKAIEK